MNLNSILPLLMSMKGSGNIDPKTMALIKAMSGNTDKSSVISEFAGSNYAPLLSILGNQKEKKSTPGGLDLITDIANDEIFGKLSRYFYAGTRRRNNLF